MRWRGRGERMMHGAKVKGGRDSEMMRAASMGDWQVKVSGVGELEGEKSI